jgi:hypothetical protein
MREVSKLLYNIKISKVKSVSLQRSWTLMFGVIYKKIADLVLRGSGIPRSIFCDIPYGNYSNLIVNR